MPDPNQPRPQPQFGGAYPAGPNSYDQTDGYSEALAARQAELSTTIGALTLAEESFNTGTTINELLTEKVRSGSMSQEDARAHADEIRALVEEAHRADHPDDPYTVRTGTEATMRGYQTNPVGKLGIRKISQAGTARVAMLEQRITDAQAGVDLFSK